MKNFVIEVNNKINPINPNRMVIVSCFFVGLFIQLLACCIKKYKLIIKLSAASVKTKSVSICECFSCSLQQFLTSSFYLLLVIVQSVLLCPFLRVETKFTKYKNLKKN